MATPLAPAAIAFLLIAALASPLLAQQGGDAAAILKRLEALESQQRVTQQQLDEIKAVIAAATRPSAPPSPVENVPPVEVSIANAAVKGQPSAKLVIIEFSDFQCPFCGRYTRETYAPLIKEFVDSGLFRYAFRNLPIAELHPQAFKAAEAGECARQQGRFWEYHALLFGNQRALDVASLGRYAQAAGLDAPVFQSCMTGNATARIREDLGMAERLGVASTPTFFVGEAQPNGTVKLLKKITGAQPYAVFQAALQGLATGVK